MYLSFYLLFIINKVVYRLLSYLHPTRRDYEGVPGGDLSWISRHDLSGTSPWHFLSFLYVGFHVNFNHCEKCVLIHPHRLRFTTCFSTCLNPLSVMTKSTRKIPSCTWYTRSLYCFPKTRYFSLLPRRVRSISCETETRLPHWIESICRIVYVIHTS
jgi:hypothetical protein